LDLFFLGHIKRKGAFDLAPKESKKRRIIMERNPASKGRLSYLCFR